MSKSKKSHRIIFIYKDKLFFCNPGKNESLEFPLSNDTVRDLEIIDQEKLEKSLKEFIGKSQTGVGETLIILNKNTYFRTTIENPNLSPEDNKNRIDQFSDLVPFEDIFVKQFTFNKKLEIIAINREFYEPILSVLQKLDFQITMILPDLVVQDFIGEASCSTEENSALLKVISRLGPYDLLGTKHKLLTKDKADTTPIKEQNKRLIILSITFAVLILILIGALIFNANRTYDDQTINPPPANVVETSIETITPQPTIALPKQLVEVETSSPSAVLELDQYKIRILNGSGVSGQAGVVKNGLQEAGFTNIDIGNSKKILSNKTQVLLNPTLPTSIRTLVLDVVENLGQEYTIQENSELNYDIVITTTAPN